MAAGTRPGGPAVTVPRVDISSLGIGPELGSGGQGTVTAVSGPLIGGQWPPALKTYSPEAAGALDMAALEAIAGFPAQLGPADSAWLLETAAWPAVIVTDGGSVRGFLMRTVPAAYQFDFQTRTRGAQRRLADVAFLLNPDDYVGAAGLSVSDRDRLALLSGLARTLCRLHGLGAAVGDLSPKNMLFSPGPAPGCFLIDCDAAQVRGRSVLPQVETPDWEVPPGEATATPAADAYKFALLAVRLFARDQSSRDPSVLAGMAPDLGRLAQASLYGGPQWRPALGEWIPVLQAAAPAASTTRISVPIPPIADPGPLPPAGPAPRRAGAAPARRGPAVALGAAAVLMILVIVAVAVGLHASAPSPAVTGGSSAGGSSAQGSAGSGGQGSSAGGSPAQGSAGSAAQPPLDQLAAIAEQDQAAVQGLADASWVPILSSKQAGTTDPDDPEFPGQPYTDEMILQNYSYWHSRYPSALLLQSQSYSSLTPGYWVVILNQPASDPADVISWCQARGLDNDDCDATLLSNQLPRGPQTYRGW